MTDLPTLSSEIRAISYTCTCTCTWKRTEPPFIGFYREYPLPPPRLQTSYIPPSLPSLLPFFLIGVFFWTYFLTAPFLQMPGHLEASELVLFYPKVRGLPRTFAWLTGQLCVSKLTVISNPWISLTFQVNILGFCTLISWVTNNTLILAHNFSIYSTTWEISAIWLA